MSSSGIPRDGSVVLRNLNVRIPKGKKVALVGETGFGKSTVIQLIERYYDPCIGSISIDGRNLKDYNLMALRKYIGQVCQWQDYSHSST